MIDRLPVRKVISATEVRNKLGALLNRVYRSEEHLVVERQGTPVAAIISMKDYEQYRRLLEERALVALARQAGAEARRQGLSEEQLLTELEETRREVFEEQYADLAQ